MGEGGGGLMGVLARAMTLLMQPAGAASAMESALGMIGEATGADRVYVFEKVADSDGPVVSQRFEWVRAGVPAEIGNPEMQNMPIGRFPSVSVGLRSGVAYQASLGLFSPPERAFLAAQGIKSLASAPVLLGGEFWGFIGIDACRAERSWSSDEMDLLRAMAAAVGGVMMRKRIEDSLRSQADELRRHRRVALSLIEDAQRAGRAAEDASRAKSTFLAMMSHEIRTPLNGVIGFTDLLLAEGLSNDQAETARAIRGCGETLLALISDILDITKIESGRVEFEKRSADLEAAARTVVASFEAEARGNGTEITLAYDAGAPRWFRADINRIRQVLFNLVGNAVKFTRGGRIDVAIGVADELAEPGTVRVDFSVTDTGPGVREEEASRIFEPFVQGEAAMKGAAGGTGLGLAISRKIVEAMGGAIRVVSPPAGGARFEFSILAEWASGPEGSSRPAERGLSAAAAAQTRVMVVDDVRTNLLLMTAMLRRLGFVPVTASSGAEACALFESGAFDLVFLDVLMPEMSGYEVVRRIREMAPTPRPWVVALTADALVENRRRCEEAGMDDFVTKPIRIDDIDACLARWRAA
jgi:signal transduction histidine kinase/ActR/RegA family two-component response regulator